MTLPIASAPLLEAPTPDGLTTEGAVAALRRIAPATVGQATTLPLPLLHAGRPALVLLEFLQPALARKELVYAPHRAATGARRCSCGPAALGQERQPG